MEENKKADVLIEDKLLKKIMRKNKKVLKDDDAKEKARKEYQEKLRKRQEQREKEEKEEFISECSEKGYSLEAAELMYEKNRQILAVSKELDSSELTEEVKKEKRNEYFALKEERNKIAKDDIKKNNPLRHTLREANDVNRQEERTNKESDFDLTRKKAEEGAVRVSNHLEERKISEHNKNTKPRNLMLEDDERNKSAKQAKEMDRLNKENNNEITYQKQRERDTR